MGLSKGVTIIEFIVTFLIFILVILATYALFDQGIWLFLSGEKRTNIQDNARVLMEGMERDFRMIGFGVPRGNDVGGAINYGSGWRPAIFTASQTDIGFTSEMDNGSTLVTLNAGTGAANRIYVAAPAYYSDLIAASGSVPIVLVSNGSQWDDLTVDSIFDDSPYDALVTSVNVPSVATFTADKSEVFTLERVFYRMTGDFDNDGNCDLGYPFCTIEKQEYTTNDPTDTTPPLTGWTLFGTNVLSLDIQYYGASGTPELDPGVASNLPLIKRIAITLICSDRSSVVGKYQTVRLKSEVLVRN